VLSVAANADAAEARPAAIEIDAGDYDLTVSANAPAKAKREVSGHLFLRSLVPTRELFGTTCRLYGWTDVDFSALGAPVRRSAPRSRDPENPGILAWQPPPALAENMKSMKSRKIAQPPGSSIMLIDTVHNKKTTRGMQDGGGIGLFVESRQGQCVRGQWQDWGIVAGTTGHFKMCRRPSGPPN